MKETRRKLEFFAPYDYDGMASYFEKMAADGWLIVGVKGNLWKYKKIQPQKLKFAVTHFEYFTVNEAAPDNGQNEFVQMCAESGWQLTAHNKTLMVFVTDSEDTVPLETDPSVQLKNLHKTVMPVLLGKNIVIAVNFIMNFLPRAIDRIKGDSSVMFTGFWWLLALFVVANVDTVDYMLWYKKANNTIKEQGEFFQQKTNKPIYVLQFVILYTVLTVCFAFIGWIVLMLCYFSF